MAAERGHRTIRGPIDGGYGDAMGDAETANEGGGHLLRWLVLIAMAIAAIAVGRKVALDRADREFEARLRELDANRE